MKLQKMLDDLKAKKAAVINEMKKSMEGLDAIVDDEDKYEAFQKSYGDLELSVGDLDAQIVSTEKKLADMLARAKSVEALIGGSEDQNPQEKFMQAPAFNKISKKLYEGDVEIRSLMANVQARRHNVSVVDMAKHMFPNDNRIEAVVRAPVAVPGTTTVGIGTELVVQADAQGELIDLLRNMLTYPRLPGMRSIPLPANRGSVRIPRTTGAISAGWVGEGVSIPVGVPSMDSITINPYKLGVITLSTKELMERSDPAYEQILRDQVLQAIAQAVDTTFIGNAAATATSPAGLLNGVAANATTMPAAPTAVQAINVFVALELALASANIEGPFVWVMATRTKFKLQALRSAIDTPLFPELSANQLMGYPVVTSNNVPVNLLGGGEAPIILMKASEVFFGLGQGIALATSDQAYIQSDTAPNTPPTGGVSLFQQEMMAIRGVLETSWLRRRDAAVSWTTSLL